MSDTGPLSEFFVVGGTLRNNAPSYVQRPADDELYFFTRAHKLCYVLTPRQMGKSSLMVRTARRLRAEGVKTAIVDLTSIGTNVTLDQWYLGFSRRVASGLRLRMDLESWWEERGGISPVQRFNDFLHDVALATIPEQIVILIDEIDATLSIDYSDDFFAAIRAMHNARATQPAFARLTFALFGVATPADLIKDRTRTPFNIGQRIDLREFSRQDAFPLREALQQAIPNRGNEVFRRVYDWTNGHPYLTQKLCATVVQRPSQNWSDGDVDALVHELFTSEEARRETNLQFMNDNIRKHPNSVQLVKLYEQVYKGKEVNEDERDPDQNQLKLIGLLQSYNGKLEVRNSIYRQVFNQDWIKANTPVNWTKRIAITAVLLIIILLGVLGFFYFRSQQAVAENINDIRATAQFGANPSIQVTNLYKLLQNENEQETAVSIFNDLTQEEKLRLFTNETASLETAILALTQATYTTLDNTAENNELLAKMQASLGSGQGAESTALAEEIGHILDGRSAYADMDYSTAFQSFSSTISSNPNNPAAYFDRAVTSAQQSLDSDSLADFEQVLSLADANGTTSQWQARIAVALDGAPPQFLGLIWEREDEFPDVIALASTLTPTPEETATPTETATTAASETPTETAVPTETLTPEPTATDTPLPTDTPTVTPLPTATPTNTPIPTITNTPRPIATPIPPTPEVGTIIFTANGTLMTTSPGRDSASSLGTAVSNSCASPAQTEDDSFNIYRGSTFCAIPTGESALTTCTSPNGGQTVVIDGRNSGNIVLLVRPSSGQDADAFHVFNGGISTSEGIRWAPNSSSFLFIDSGRVMKGNLGGSWQAIASNSASEPIFSADSANVLYKDLSNNNLYVVGANGGSTQAVTNDGAAKSCHAWSN